MGIYTSFHLIYGFRLSSKLKNEKTGKDFSPFDEEFEPYLEGSESVEPFTLLWDQMGSGQKTIFGQGLCYMSGDEAGDRKVDIGNLQKKKVKELYLELFKDYGVSEEDEPELISVVHMS